MNDPSSMQDDLLLLARASGKGAAASFAEEELVKRYTPLVYSFTRNCYRNGWERSDFVQEGMLGLIKAIREYAPERGVSFSTFASVCIKNELSSALRRSLSLRHSPLSDYVSLSPGSESALTELLHDESDQLFESVLLRDEAQRCLAALSVMLSPFEKKVLSAWMRGFAASEIADALSKPEKSVENALVRIRVKARSPLLRR